jgi:hypothetical protein
MKKKTPDKHEPRGEAGGSVGGILSGLAGLVEKLNELAETGGELRRAGEIHGAGKELKGIYGFTVKVGLATRGRASSRSGTSAPTKPPARRWWTKSGNRWWTCSRRKTTS